MKSKNNLRVLSVCSVTLIKERSFVALIPVMLIISGLILIPTKGIVRAYTTKKFTKMGKQAETVCLKKINRPLFPVIHPRYSQIDSLYCQVLITRHSFVAGTEILYNAPLAWHRLFHPQ